MMRKAELIKQNLLKRREGRTDVSNMYKVLLVVECEYISQDSKGRLYLSQVQEVRNPAVRMRSKKASVIAAKLILSVVLTALPAAWSVIYAFLERGYKAYGGEHMQICISFKEAESWKR